MGTPVCASARERFSRISRSALLQYPVAGIQHQESFPPTTFKTFDVNGLGGVSGISKKPHQTNIHALIELEFHPELVSLKGHSGRESTQLRMQERPGCLPF